jgi:hypothetical protein
MLLRLWAVQGVGLSGQGGGILGPGSGDTGGMPGDLAAREVPVALELEPRLQRPPPDLICCWLKQ